MSRHRHFRSGAINVNAEYDNRYGDSEYGRSVEEHACVSPGTESYIFNREDSRQNLGDFFASHGAQIDEEDEDGTCNDDSADGYVLKEDVVDSAHLRHDCSVELVVDSVLEQGKPQRIRAGRGRRRATAATNESTGGDATTLAMAAVSVPSGIAVETGMGGKVTKGFHCGDTLLDVPTPSVENTSPKPSPKHSPQMAQRKLSAAGAVGSSGGSADVPDTPRRISRVSKFDAVGEYEKRRAASGGKELINLVVIGHVDAGKSTLMGHLLYRLGEVGSRQMHRYENDSRKLGKASFCYAWVLDESGEERARGITMDIAQSSFTTTHKHVVLLDAPGHRDFIPNMITGAATADVALLVVDATRGEFETGFEQGGQTREHALLVRSLGVSQLIIAVNKLETCAWSQERFVEIRDKLHTFLTKQAGFREADLTYVPCSGLTGVNLTSPPQSQDQPQLTDWYHGPTLVQLIDEFVRSPERLITGPLRYVIGDVYKGGSGGACVSGRLESGYVMQGDRVIIMPQQQQATVKGVEVVGSEGGGSYIGFAGDQCQLTLTNIDNAVSITVGSILSHIGPAASLPPVASRIRASIVVFNTLQKPITNGFPVVFHYQSVSEQACISKLISQLHKTTGEVMKKRPRCIMKNSRAVVEVELVRPICIELYKDYKELGRFMLRYSTSTIAAGVVTEILK